MIRTAVITAVLLGAACAAHAELDKGAGFNDLAMLDGLGRTEVEGLSRQVWSTVPDISATDVSRLIAQVDDATSGRNGPVAMAQLLKLQEELTRQTRSFKQAYRAAAGMNTSVNDVDGLITQVVDGVGATVDQRYFKAVASRYEALYTQFGQYVNARFLASNATGIPTYKRSTPAVDAASVAEQARIHMATYQANLATVGGELRTLLNLETASR